MFSIQLSMLPVLGVLLCMKGKTSIETLTFLWSNFFVLPNLQGPNFFITMLQSHWLMLLQNH